MTRLPKVGGDNGSWGIILNEFLSQAHETDGTLKAGTVDVSQLKPNSVTTTSIADGAVTPPKLSGLGASGGIATLDGGGKLISGQIPSWLTAEALASQFASRQTQTTVEEGRLSPDQLEATIIAQIEANLVVNTELVGDTTDTAEAYKLLFFSDGTVRAVPIGATAPAMPTNVVLSATVSKVSTRWDAVNGAATYRIYRNGSLLTTVTNTNYADWNVVAGYTYSYQLSAVNQYNMASPLTDAQSILVDASLNSAPTVSVTVWPAQNLPGQKQVVRVAAADVDAQILALALDVSEGSLEPTLDPSVWYLTTTGGS